MYDYHYLWVEPTAFLVNFFMAYKAELIVLVISGFIGVTIRASLSRAKIGWRARDINTLSLVLTIVSFFFLYTLGGQFISLLYSYVALIVLSFLGLIFYYLYKAAPKGLNVIVACLGMAVVISLSYFSGQPHIGLVLLGLAFYLIYKGVQSRGYYSRDDLENAWLNLSGAPSKAKRFADDAVDLDNDLGDFSDDINKDLGKDIDVIRKPKDAKDKIGSEPIAEEQLKKYFLAMFKLETEFFKNFFALVLTHMRIISSIKEPQAVLNKLININNALIKNIKKIQESKNVFEKEFKDLLGKDNFVSYKTNLDNLFNCTLGFDFTKFIEEKDGVTTLKTDDYNKQLENILNALKDFSSTRLTVLSDILPKYEELTDKLRKLEELCNKVFTQLSEIKNVLKPKPSAATPTPGAATPIAAKGSVIDLKINPVEQANNTSCGLACVQMILDYLGIEIPGNNNKDKQMYLAAILLEAYKDKAEHPITTIVEHYITAGPLQSKDWKPTFGHEKMKDWANAKNKEDAKKALTDYFKRYKDFTTELLPLISIMTGWLINNEVPTKKEITNDKLIDHLNNITKKGTIEKDKELPPILLIDPNQGHFVLFNKFDGTNLIFNDPLTGGEQNYTLDEINSNNTYILYFLKISDETYKEDIINWRNKKLRKGRGGARRVIQ